VLGSVFAARKERWWLAGALGAFSWMTRANGIVLLPTLAVEAGTPMVHRQTLAMAVALDRARAGRVCSLFVSELADLRRSTRISKNAEGTLSHVILLAVDRNHRCVPQSSADAKSG